MTRKEVIGDCTLYCDDCLRVLRFDSASWRVDAVVTDPPYGVKAELNSKTAKREPWSISGERRKNAYGTFDDSVEYVRDRVVPSFVAALALCGRGIVTTGNRCVSLYPMPDSFGVFYQPASIGLQRWGRCDCQPILYYGAFPHESRAIPGNSCSFVLTESPEQVGHPCRKPFKAWTRIVAMASRQGETVLDPFMGSGTTGEICVKSGRKFIGIEIEPKYFDISCRRVQKAWDEERTSLLTTAAKIEQPELFSDGPATSTSRKRKAAAAQP